MISPGPWPAVSLMRTSRRSGATRRRSQLRIGSSASSAATTMPVATAAVPMSPTPAVRPTAEVTHSDAAVVRFLMAVPCRKMTPAPRKPMPTTTCDATRVTSIWMLVSARARTNSENPSVDTTPNRQAPRHTAMWVRRPAGCSPASRSAPMTAPRATATASRSSASVSYLIPGVPRR